MKNIRFLILFIVVLYSVSAALAEQPEVLETFPPQGSYQTDPCGPFGVRLLPGTLTQPEDVLSVRGSATGIRHQGELNFSDNGDTLLFTPAVPFAAGEEVTVTLKGDTGYTWQTTIRPRDENLTGTLSDMHSGTISLEEYFPSGSLEFLSWTWADLNADRDLEGVLLTESDGVRYLTTVARRYNYQSQTESWQVRAPAVCTTDNPVDLLSLDLDGNAQRDLVMLSLGGLQFWTNPGADLSPQGSLSSQHSFPPGFISRTMVSGDVDDDGDDDLVVFGLFGLQYLVVLNNGSGNLEMQDAQPVPVNEAANSADKNQPWPIHALLKDVDGDGRTDLIWTADYQEQGNYRLRMAHGRGDGTFDDPGIVSESTSFSAGIMFGRLLDPWDDSPTPASLLNAGLESTTDNLCGFMFDGSWPPASAGCLTIPDLSSFSLVPQAARILDIYPELWYSNSQTGDLNVCTLEATPSIQTLSFQAELSAIKVGDLNYDGDGDAALLVADQSIIVLLQTPGGVPQRAPVTDGANCGGLMDFGVREIQCSEAAQVAYIPFTNEGLLPSRITLVDLEDYTSAFSVSTWPTQYFGDGCLSSGETAMLPVNFAPQDTVQYSANLTVNIVWVGAAYDGSDSTLVCDFQLQGRGGLHKVQDNNSGIGSLFWSQGDGYSTTGSALDFGTLPALSEVTVSTEIHLTNTGDFPVDVSPPDNTSSPFSYWPAGSRTLVPGQTQNWTLTVQPNSSLVPAGTDSIDVFETSQWTVRSLAIYNCLPDQIITQDLSVRLLSAAPCLASDPDCSGAATVCTSVDTLVVTEDDVFGYCLNQIGWTWPQASPEFRVVENTLPWLNIQQLAPPEVALPIISLTSDLVGAEGGDLLVELRDAVHPTVVRSFHLTVIVEPSRPDISIVDMMFLPINEDDEIQQQHPFLVDVVVEVARQPVQGAVMGLEGGYCTCDVDPLEKVLINLVEGRRDTVRFVVDSCAEAGECPFTACIEPPEGIDGDFNPDDNCFTVGTMIAANRAPSIEISNLILSPEDPTLEPCQSGIILNEINGGMVQAFGVREENNLTFDVRSLDIDGDDTMLVVGLLPPFVHATASGDTMVSFDITPPEGTVVEEVCQMFGPLVFQVIELNTADPETTIVEIPLYVKWEGGDLESSVINVPTSVGLAEVVRFNGRVRSLGYNSGPFTVDLWLEDPDGVRVAGRQTDFLGLASGASVNVPQVLFEVDRPGEYCAHIDIIAGRDVNPDNNADHSCFPVAAGPFVVSPNVATPNGDGHNDYIVFRFQNQTMENPSIRIFELGGHLVYETNVLDGTRSLTWNGRNQSGDPMPPGTYIYVVYNEGREFRTGTCGVVR